MRRKEQYADEIIKMLERTKGGAWASNINLNTKDRVIEVCQNCVDSWSGRKFKDHCTTPPQALEQTRWIPVERELPEEGEDVLVYIERNAWDEDGFRFKKKCIDIGWHIDSRWHCDGCNGVVGIAWMPLPPSYEPQESEDAE